MVTVVLVKHTRKKLAKDNKKKKEVIQGTIKAIISIVSVMVMFGLSWLFGALSISDGAIFFQWPFVIFNTLQGFILFLFSCVIGKDARDEWIALFSCNRNKKKRRHGTAYSQSHSTVSKAGKYSGNSTKQTELTTKSSTFKKSDLSSSSVCSSSKAPLPVESNVYVKHNLASIAEKTELVTADSLALVSQELTEDVKVDETPKLKSGSSTHKRSKHSRKKNESVVPPHIQFRLNRPYYEVIVGYTVSMELSQETDFTHDIEVTEPSQYDVFANLTGDSVAPLISDDDA